MGDFKGCGVA